MNIDFRIIEGIFAIGLGAITYFLKLIHNDLRGVIAKVQDQATSLAVGKEKFGELERRIEKLESQATTA